MVGQNGDNDQYMMSIKTFTLLIMKQKEEKKC